MICGSRGSMLTCKGLVSSSWQRSDYSFKPTPLLTIKLTEAHRNRSLLVKSQLIYLQSSIMLDKFFRLIILFSATFICTTAATSATIEIMKTPARIILTGDIEEGDSEKLALAISTIKPIYNDFFLLPSSIILNSNGGDVNEALKISLLVKALYLNTVTPYDAKGVCASSCFFIFISGLKRSATGIDTLNTEGKRGSFGPIGVHRPYLTEVKGGPDSMRHQEDIMRAVSGHLNKERIPQSIIDIMMSHASNDVYWLLESDLKLLGRFRAGYEEELIAKCGYNQKQEDQMNASEWMESQSSGVLNCVSEYNVEIYVPLRNATAAKLRKGWRPWKN